MGSACYAIFFIFSARSTERTFLRQKSTVFLRLWLTLALSFSGSLGHFDSDSRPAKVQFRWRTFRYGKESKKQFSILFGDEVQPRLLPVVVT